jgi:hypothetical protein
MKFKIVKHFSLAYLGTDWKDCYLDLKPLSISDVKGKLPEISKLQAKDADVGKGVDLLLELLSDKFIGGKVVDDTGKIVELPKEALGDLPVEVIGRAFSFLSSADAIAPPSSTP